MLTGAVAATVYACLNVPAVIARVQTPVTSESADGPILPASVLGSAYLPRYRISGGRFEDRHDVSA